MLITVSATDFEQVTDYSTCFVSIKYKEIEYTYHVRLEDISYIRERNNAEGAIFVIGFCGKELRITEDEAGRIIRLMEDEERL